MRMTTINKLLHSAAVLLCCVLTGCTSGPEELSVVPQPSQVSLHGGWYRVDSAAFRRNPTAYISFASDSSIPAEGYLLEVDRKGISVTSSDCRGAFYAQQTLLQMLSSEGIPCGSIADAPRFPYRGLMVDVSRHFFPKEEIFRMLDVMAAYKMNYFHLHLTDNGGWRILLDRYPELTRKGAFRTKKSWIEWWDKQDKRYLDEGTTGAYGGYYTKDELREIVAYAAERHIEVIPEVEFPAHSDAVFISHPELCCQGKAYSSGEYCAGNPQTYEFFFNVLDEIMEVFPSRYIHIGGDEARKKEWPKCPKCRALMQREGIADYDELQCYMVDRVEDYLRSKGKVMCGWDEISKNELDPEAIVFSYRGQEYTSHAANKGQNVIFTPGAALYFDWYQDTPQTQPRAMVGYSPIRKTYLMEPLANTPAKALANEQYILGRRIDEPVEWISGEQAASRVLGVQGCAWSEFIDDCPHLEYMVLPRILAIAEMGWTPASGRDWDDFKRRLSVRVPALRAAGLNCYTLSDRVDISSVISEGGAVVSFECEKYQSELRYTLDGSTPDANSTLYTAPFGLAEPALVKVSRFEGGVPVGTDSLFVGTLEPATEYYPYVEPDHWKNI